MKTVSSEVANLLEEGRISVRGGILFQFGTGTYAFIKAITPFSYAGNTYQPGGIIEVSDFTFSTGRTAQPFTLTLAASDYDNLTPEILQSIEAEDYRDRPVTIYDFYFHPDTNEFLYALAQIRGYVDTIDHEDGNGTGYTLIANCETRALDYTRRNDRRRTDADQLRRLPAGITIDKWFEHCGMRGREQIYWGRTSPVVMNPNIAAGRGFIAGVTNV